MLAVQYMRSYAYIGQTRAGRDSHGFLLGVHPKLPTRLRR